MIQIIGWLLCVYLVIKALELLAMPTRDAIGRQLALVGAAIGVIAAPVFFFMLDAQAKHGADSMTSVQSYSDCIRESTTVAEMSRCKP